MHPIPPYGVSVSPFGVLCSAQDRAAVPCLSKIGPALLVCAAPQFLPRCKWSPPAPSPAHFLTSHCTACRRVKAHKQMQFNNEVFKCSNTHAGAAVANRNVFHFYRGSFLGNWCHRRPHPAWCWLLHRSRKPHRCCASSHTQLHYNRQCPEWFQKWILISIQCKPVTGGRKTLHPSTWHSITCSNTRIASTLQHASNDVWCLSTLWSLSATLGLRFNVQDKKLPRNWMIIRNLPKLLLNSTWATRLTRESWRDPWEFFCSGKLQKLILTAHEYSACYLSTQNSVREAHLIKYLTAPLNSYLALKPAVPTHKH